MIRTLVAILLLTALGFALTAPTFAAGGRDLDGVVAAVAENSLLMVDSQRREILFAVNPGTRILRNGKPAVMSQIALGDDVRVTAITRNSRWMAKTISAIGLD